MIRLLEVEQLGEGVGTPVVFVGRVTYLGRCAEIIVKIRALVGCGGWLCTLVDCFGWCVVVII